MGGFLSSVLSGVARAPAAALNGAEALGAGAARGAAGLKASPAPSYAIDPDSGQMSTAQAPATRGQMWKNLLSGALMGLAAGDRRGVTGPEALGQGYGGALAERQRQDLLARQQAQRQFADTLTARNAADERTLNAVRMHALDIENAKNALWLKDEPAAHVAQLRLSSGQLAEALERTGHKMVGTIADERDLGQFYKDHPDLAKKFAAGDVHLVPAYGDDGRVSGFDVYEMPLPSGAMAPIGTPAAVTVGGRTVTLPADTPAWKFIQLTSALAAERGKIALRNAQTAAANALAASRTRAVGAGRSLSALEDVAKQRDPMGEPTPQAALAGATLVHISQGMDPRFAAIEARKDVALAALEARYGARTKDGKPTGLIPGAPPVAAKQAIQDAYEAAIRGAGGRVTHYQYPALAPPAAAPAPAAAAAAARVRVRLANGVTGTMPLRQAQNTPGVTVLP